MTGNAHDALRAYCGYSPYVQCGCGCEDDPRREKTRIGQGESRTVWLVGGVVYKVGRDSANQAEHEALTAWREAGATWAPATTLHHLRGEYGEPVVVLAMPYLPDDGSPVDTDTLADIRSAAPQTCRENYSAHQGHTYLIDGGDIEVYPAAVA